MRAIPFEVEPQSESHGHRLAKDTPQGLLLILAPACQQDGLVRGSLTGSVIPDRQNKTGPRLENAPSPPEREPCRRRNLVCTFWFYRLEEPLDDLYRRFKGPFIPFGKAFLNQRGDVSGSGCASL